MNGSILHDAAFITAKSVMDIFALLIEDDEYDRVFAVVFHTCKAGLEAYQIQRNREAQRLVPSRN